ncbi:MAG: hypothetical protein C0616_12350 [Desulfuromonas sp.]|nr:MAG: hypothetical protein C0616_12350 [Desulfuromonas sp.]
MKSLQNAIIRLLKQRPFYGHLLLGLDRRAVNGATVGITLAGGQPTLCCDAGTFASHSGREQEALLEHALRHLLHLHPVRRKQRHPLVWDIACDLAVNQSIEGLPDSALLPGVYGLENGLAAEEYYQQLSTRFQVGNLTGQGVGETDAGTGQTPADQPSADKDALMNEAARRDRLDNHQVWQEADSTPQRLAEEAVRQLTREAYRQADGEVAGDLQLLVNGLLAPPPLPWREVLRQFVASAGRAGRQNTWKREHRRFAHDTPGQRKRRRLNLLIGIDVSDSTMKRELREAFAAELVRIARGRESRITVLYSGSRIQKIESFTSSNAVAEVYHGGGFTDLRPVFHYAREMRPQPAAVIYLTDGYGEAPERMDLPTLWVLTEDGKRPTTWGVELRLRSER